ncbi:MAG: hypothetical protein EPO08_18830 [Rhodospirillaceae bacterium]|nr:MAG: hypothetical protein EPO08_18830 [Rhodospirillaceae bacterium]
MNIPVVFRNHFQCGYVVRDIDKAIANMGEKFGVSKWQINRLSADAPGRALGFAYVQNVMIELVDVRPEQETIYRSWIPESDTAVRLHHLGYMIDTEEEWRSVISQFKAAGFRTALEGSVGDILDYYYADTVAELGHYCEFVRLKPAGKSFWANVPHN